MAAVSSQQLAGGGRRTAPYLIVIKMISRIRRPFDFAQGGELVEPQDANYSRIQIRNSKLERGPADRNKPETLKPKIDIQNGPA